MMSFAALKYDTVVEYIEELESQELRQVKPSPHRSLLALANLLGRQAAAHVHQYRFEGLGRIELIRLQEEAARLSSDRPVIKA